ncbi:MAG: DUF3299 domain-containing protein [Planctomycetales bacterium]
MSQVVSEVEHPFESPAVDPASEFDYHPVTPLAPITLFLGICALAGLIGIPGLAIGIVGLITGGLGLWQIRRSQGEVGGRVVALCGVWLSGLFLVAGIGLHTYAYATEVPEGFERVSFNWLSSEAPTIGPGELQVTPAVEALDGKPIFIKGYMYPTQQRTGKTEFVMLKDTGQCCFGGNPKITDMIVVKMQNGMTVDHKEQTLVGVAGTFRAQSVVQSGQLTAIYSLEATHFK